MSVRAKSRPPTRPVHLQRTLVESTPTESQAHSVLTAAVAELERAASPFTDVTVDLQAGNNTVNHGLGRKPLGMVITPTVADATFAWAMTAADERQATIAVVGTSQPGAMVRVF